MEPVAWVAESAFDVIGRDAEIASLGAWISDLDALPNAIVLDGEAGMGKTTLWRHGIELASAAFYGVLSASPSESEAELSFVALGDLLEPVLDEVLAALPMPQRSGLAVALLREEVEGSPPDPHAIARSDRGVDVGPSSGWRCWVAVRGGRCESPHVARSGAGSRPRLTFHAVRSALAASPSPPMQSGLARRRQYGGSEAVPFE